MEVAGSNLLWTVVYLLLGGTRYWKSGRSFGHGLARYMVMSIVPQVRYPVEALHLLYAYISIFFSFLLFFFPFSSPPPPLFGGDSYCVVRISVPVCEDCCGGVSRTTGRL
jgi:hypothetical protein